MFWIFKLFIIFKITLVFLIEKCFDLIGYIFLNCVYFLLLFKLNYLNDQI